MAQTSGAIRPARRRSWAWCRRRLLFMKNCPAARNSSSGGRLAGIIQKLDHQLVVSAQNSRHPSECLRDLLELPVRVENVTLKRPSLNDVFLQLTGRELRE